MLSSQKGVPGYDGIENESSNLETSLGVSWHSCDKGRGFNDLVFHLHGHFRFNHCSLSTVCCMHGASDPGCACSGCAVSQLGSSCRARALLRISDSDQGLGLAG